MFYYVVVISLISITQYLYANDKKKMNIETIPSSFELIQLDRWEKSECTPKMDIFKERGIVLNSPEKVLISEEFILPLCGIWTFSEKFINEHPTIDTDTTLVVTDKSNFKSYSANLARPDFEYEPRSKSTGTEEELNFNAEQSYFNINVYDYVVKLPKKRGVFSIYATIGDVKSNVVEIEIITK